jgi:hypothetical protein
MSKPTPQVHVDCITTSSIRSLMILPVNVQEATNLKPGMINNRIAEALMVCSAVCPSLTIQ